MSARVFKVPPASKYLHDLGSWLYLGIALGSLHEMEAIVELIETLKYIPPEEMVELKARRADCARMVYGMIQRFS
jgi:four helix bundle protein